MIAASACAEPATVSLVPTAISVGARIDWACSRGSVWREPRMQAASARRSDLVCSAKTRNWRPTGAVDEVDPEPAEDQRARPRGMTGGQERADAGPHRIAEEVGATEPEVVEQGNDVFDHPFGVIIGGIVELARPAVAAVVQRDGAPAGAAQRRHPPRIDPIDFLGRGEAVHEHDRLAVAFVEKRDLDLAVPEALHGGSDVIGCRREINHSAWPESFWLTFSA